MGDVRGGAGAVTGTVLVDTNVFTARLRERSPLATRYAKHLFGQRIALAPQTVAEARYGALNANWGPARQEQLARLVARARILPIDIDTIEAVAEPLSLPTRCFSGARGRKFESCRAHFGTARKPAGWFAIAAAISEAAS
jgi:hypothetical protein